MAKDLLIEIGCEELPAGYANSVLAGLPELFRTNFTAMSGTTLGDEVVLQALGTPRRLVLRGQNLPELTPTTQSKVMGPPTRAAFKDGKPTPAAKGFAAKLGLSVEDLQVEKTPKGDYLFGERVVGGEPMVAVLSRCIPSLIDKISFPKSMRWGGGDVRFARPVRWLLALVGDEVVPFTWGTLQSSNQTWGHRFMGDGSVAVTGFDDYVKKLKKAYVVVDPQERMELIRGELKKAAQEAGGQPEEDAELLETVNFLVEHPTGILGHFEKELLALPREVIVTPMKHHQRYFPVVDDRGALLNAFVAVVGTPPEDPALVIRGNERVLKARLADAQFFYDEDMKATLPKMAEGLSRVVFQVKLGSYAEKVQRMESLACSLGETLQGQGIEIDLEVVRQACRLCKADLVSKMVYEFPELQGVMGREYALKAGMNPQVADAICEHYQPRRADEPVPVSAAGALISLAERFDSLVGIFGIGERPTGSADPYALRRHALAVLSILRAKGWPLSIAESLKTAANLLVSSSKLESAHEAVEETVLFVRERFYHQLVGEGLAYDAVDAVLEAGFDDVQDVVRRAQALTDLKASPELEPVATGFKRAANILAKAPAEDLGVALDAGSFVHDAEKALHKTAMDVASRVQETATQKQWSEALGQVVHLAAPIDTFYDAVMVMDKEDTLRRNRLALLAEVVSIFAGIADFSRIVVEGK